MPVQSKSRPVPKARRTLEIFCPLNQITSTNDYKRAHDLAERLAELPQRNSEQQEYFDALIDLITAYQEWEAEPDADVSTTQIKRRLRHG